MLRTVALNALFLAAGYASSTVDTILYKLALIAIVLLLHTLWVRAVIKRATTTSLNRTEQTLDLILTNWNDGHPNKQ